MSKYTHILFDLDGTIVDSSPGIIKSITYALDIMGVTIDNPAILYRFIGPPLKNSFINFFGMNDETAEQAVKLYREVYNAKNMYDNILYDGFKDVVATLKDAGFKLYVATSKPEIFAKKILERHNLLNYFEFVGGSELAQGAAGKTLRANKVEVINYVLDSCGIDDKEQVLMIGDTDFDIKGANEVGIDSLGVLYGFGTRESMEEAGATFISPSLNGILEYLS